MSKIKRRCPLYFTTGEEEKAVNSPTCSPPPFLPFSLPSPSLPGEMVQRERDKTVELEFNRLLDSVSHLSHHLHLDQLGGKPLSLGHALELVIQ